MAKTKATEGEITMIVWEVEYRIESTPGSMNYKNPIDVKRLIFWTAIDSLRAVEQGIKQMDSNSIYHITMKSCVRLGDAQSSQPATNVLFPSWIAFTEKQKPKPDRDYLLYSPHIGIRSVHIINSEDGYFYQDGVQYAAANFTHWMELPDAPRN